MINDGCEKSELWNLNRNAHDLGERRDGTNQDSNAWDPLRSPKTSSVTTAAKSVPALGIGVSQCPSC